MALWPVLCLFSYSHRYLNENPGNHLSVHLHVDWEVIPTFIFEIRTSYIICVAQCKVKMWGPLFKISSEVTVRTVLNKHGKLRNPASCASAHEADSA